MLKLIDRHTGKAVQIGPEITVTVALCGPDEVQLDIETPTARRIAIALTGRRPFRLSGQRRAKRKA